jgi:hypothetical protein
MASGWWIILDVASLPVSGTVAIVVVLWHRHKRIARQPLYPPFRPNKEHALCWDNTRRREEDPESTTRFPSQLAGHCRVNGG